MVNGECYIMMVNGCETNNVNINGELVNHGEWLTANTTSELTMDHDLLPSLTTLVIINHGEC